MLNLPESPPKRKPLLMSSKEEEKQQHSRLKKKLTLLTRPEEMKPRESPHLLEQTELPNKKQKMRREKQRPSNSRLRMKLRTQRPLLLSELPRERQENSSKRSKRLRSRDNSLEIQTKN